MRCMACGADMILVKVIADETMPVRGFQRHAYMCSLCHDTEQRLFFNKHAQERELEIVPAPVETGSTVRNLRAAPKGFLEPRASQIAACPERAVILSACVVITHRRHSYGLCLFWARIRALPPEA
jgi:hypothetical protein